MSIYWLSIVSSVVSRATESTGVVNSATTVRSDLPDLRDKAIRITALFVACSHVTLATLACRFPCSMIDAAFPSHRSVASPSDFGLPLDLLKARARAVRSGPASSNARCRSRGRLFGDHLILIPLEIALAEVSRRDTVSLLSECSLVFLDSFYSIHFLNTQISFVAPVFDQTKLNGENVRPNKNQIAVVAR